MIVLFFNSISFLSPAKIIDLRCGKVLIVSKSADNLVVWVTRQLA
ncbi:MAG: hypothetical protein KCCBMMGE_02330 [Candidatus Methanoperedenaceae archaeon GB37]|nr:MAG: hypothetical protein KCCBMMGE_02330 [Candidatus Methanoperedenaceae archaeon GB37]